MYSLCDIPVEETLRCMKAAEGEINEWMNATARPHRRSRYARAYIHCLAFSTYIYISLRWQKCFVHDILSRRRDIYLNSIQFFILEKSLVFQPC